jgi:hypothetical protein
MTVVVAPLRRGAGPHAGGAVWLQPGGFSPVGEDVDFFERDQSVAERQQQEPVQTRIGRMMSGMPRW